MLGKRNCPRLVVTMLVALCGMVASLFVNANGVNAELRIASGAEALAAQAPERWKRIFSEDFNREAPLGSFLKIYGNQWGAYPEPWKDTTKRGTYSPEKTLSVHNGIFKHSPPR